MLLFSSLTTNIIYCMEDQEKYCSEEEQLDEKLIDELIEESPKEIQKIIRIITKRIEPNNLLQAIPFLSNMHLLVGPSGAGKTSLAKAIALKCGLRYTFVSFPALVHQYNHSGQSDLINILGPLKENKEPKVIILDGLQMINEDYDADYLSSFLDTFKKKKNFLIIATANERKNLPEQIRKHIYNAHAISLPNQKKEKRLLIIILLCIHRA